MSDAYARCKNGCCDHAEHEKLTDARDHICGACYDALPAQEQFQYEALRETCECGSKAEIGLDMCEPCMLKLYGPIDDASGH